MVSGDPNSLPALSPDEYARYSRHLILPEVGMEGQRSLKAARVLCVGTGGLGSPLAPYLAAAGSAPSGLVDFDVVDASNLQRQIIHSTTDIGRKKLDSAAEKLIALNPALNVVKPTDTSSPAPTPLKSLKDLRHRRRRHRQFPQRAIRLTTPASCSGKPNAYASIFRFEGQASVFATERRPVLSLPLS